VLCPRCKPENYRSNIGIVREEKGREEKREGYLHNDPTTFEYTSFIEQKAKNACRLLCRYHRVVSQFAHTDIRADTKLGVKLSARALYCNAAIEQYQCTKIEQMNEIEGTTEFGADAARVVLLGQVEWVHDGWKFMVPPVKILLNGFDSVGCQTWGGHVDVQDVALERATVARLMMLYIETSVQKVEEIKGSISMHESSIDLAIW
jgi:hypothetical protein